MKIKKINQYKDILIVVFCVIVLDILLKNYFVIVYKETGYGLIIFDAIISFFAIFIGKMAANVVGIPIWQTKYETINKQHLLISIIIGVIMIAINTLIWNNNNADTVTWARFTDYFEPIYISLRAALIEELFFRLFIFSVVMLLVRKVSKSDIIALIAGALLSSIFFGLYHQGFYLGFLYGILLCYIYKHNGLVLAMIIHFLSDAVPFVVIYMKQSNQ